MRRQFENVSELIKALSSESDFKNQAIAEIQGKRIPKFLFCLRCEQKLTQKALAEKIGCTQSKVSKIESSYDRDLTIQDLLDYGNALGLELEIGYRSKGIRTIDMIKFHAFRIKHYLGRLVELSKGDEKFQLGVLETHLEALYNLSRMIKESASKIDIRKDQPKEVIHLSSPINEEDKDLCGVK